MAQPLLDSTYGDDFGFGDGPGYGDVFGYGAGGYGDGSGYGDGFGDGHRAGHGFGYGGGYCFGHGCNDGSGYGSGDGYALPDFAGYNVHVPWPGVLIIGCQTRSIDHWRQHWRDIAQEHGEVVDEAKVLALLSQAEAVTIHDIFPPTS